MGSESQSEFLPSCGPTPVQHSAGKILPTLKSRQSCCPQIPVYVEITPIVAEHTLWRRLGCTENPETDTLLTILLMEHESKNNHSHCQPSVGSAGLTVGRNWGRGEFLTEVN